jgi:MFS family permease
MLGVPSLDWGEFGRISISINVLTGSKTNPYPAFLSVGILVMIVPLYQAELAHPDIRGRITSLQQLMLGVGSLVAAWISWGTYINFADDDSRQWRISLGIQMVPAVFLAALILLFPESPRWLIDHGRLDDGLQTLARLHSGGDINDPWVQTEFDQIQTSIASEHEAEAKSYTELFTDPSCFRRLFLACSIQAACQMTGVSAIQYFSTTIFKQIGIATNDTLKYQGISSIIAIIAQLCCLLFIDKTGRRWPQIIGNLVNCVFFVCYSCPMLFFHLTNFSDHSHNPHRQVPPRNHPQQCSQLGIHRHDLVLQLLLQRDHRPAHLGYLFGNLRHQNTFQGCFYRYNDLVRIQHVDRPGY